MGAAQLRSLGTAFPLCDFASELVDDAFVLVESGNVLVLESLQTLTVLVGLSSAGRRVQLRVKALLAQCGDLQYTDSMSGSRCLEVACADARDAQEGVCGLLQYAAPAAHISTRTCACAE